MRLRKVAHAQELLEHSFYYLKEPEKYKGEWSSVFANANEIHLEIGTGKGNFLIAKALAYPNINFIGIEKEESVLVRAIQKLADKQIRNLKFICADASNIEDIFSQEISLLYLNFSDPWPKKKHEKRRLTSSAFLNSFEKIFLKNVHIIQKTDNCALFAYSLEQYSQKNYLLKKVSLDLASEDIENFKTEYEEKFMSLGCKINYVEVIKNIE